MYLLVLAYPGCPGQSPEGHKIVVVVVVVVVLLKYEHFCDFQTTFEDRIFETTEVFDRYLGEFC